MAAQHLLRLRGGRQGVDGQREVRRLVAIRRHGLSAALVQHGRHHRCARPRRVRARGVRRRERRATSSPAASARLRPTTSRSAARHPIRPCRSIRCTRRLCAPTMPMPTSTRRPTSSTATPTARQATTLLETERRHERQLLRARRREHQEQPGVVQVRPAGRDARPGQLPRYGSHEDILVRKVDYNGVPCAAGRARAQCQRESRSRPRRSRPTTTATCWSSSRSARSADTPTAGSTSSTEAPARCCGTSRSMVISARSPRTAPATCT